MSFYLSRTGHKVYAKTLKTPRIKEIIEYAKSKQTSMAASTAAIYDRIRNMAIIKKLIDRDLRVLRAVSKSRIAIPKKLAEETVQRYNEYRASIGK